MSFFSFQHCFDLQKGPFSSLGESNMLVVYLQLLIVTHCPKPGLGAIRTATKRAGGTVRNHGGSPGQRLGIKKFAGACTVGLADGHTSDPKPCPMVEEYVIPGNIIVRQRGTWFHPGQHVRGALHGASSCTHFIVGKDGQGPHTIRHGSRFCSLLQGTP